METVLSLRLQVLQRRLYEMANHLGTLTAPEMIAASEEADQVVLQLQKLRMLEWKSRSRDSG